MARVWSGCSTSCGSFSQELPMRSKKGGEGTRIHPRNGGRSRGDARQVQAVSTMVIMARVCVCRAAPCVLESDVAGKEEVGMGVWGLDDEPPGADGFDHHERHGRRPVRPAVVEKGLVDARSASSALVSGAESKSELGRSRLHFLEERDEEMLSKRLTKLSQSNKVRSATELFYSMRASGLQPSAHACNSLLASFVRRSSLADAMKMFEFMKEKGIATGHTYTTLILKAVASTEGYTAALQMFNEIEEDSELKKILDVIVYNTMISLCGRAKDWTQAERLWRRLGENSLSGTLMTYDLLVSTFVQCGQSELAIAAYQEMLRNGLKPSEDIMKAIIASCTKEGTWEFALDTFRRMLSAGMKPNIILFNSIINSLGKAGEDELAFRMYHLLTSSGLRSDQYTWSALLSVLYRSGRCWDALELFQGIKSKHSSLLNSHLYNIALMSCEKLGQWEHALQLLWMMEKTGLQMSAVSYNHVIRACEVAKKPKVALKVYDRMTHQRCSPDTFTHLSVIRACIWGSLWNEVEDILEVMILIGETGSGKSTQLVQFLADSGLAANGSIVCTQPRKIAAVSLSHRVDEESNGCYGDNFVLSYPTFLISQDFSSKIIFTTDSCLLHHCMNDMGLDGISFIIVDEAHERSLNTDLLLALIKKKLLDRLDLRLIIMSATADANRLAEYFYGCQTFHVKGRSFPVEIKYVPDIPLESSFNTIPNPLRGACATAAYVYDVVRMVNIIHKNEEEGAVLAFLNGLVKTSAIQMLWYFRCMESFPM